MDQEAKQRVFEINKAGIYTIISVLAFLAACMSGALLFGGSFNVRPEIMAQRPNDPDILTTLIIITPLFYITGWVSMMLGRKYSQMIASIILCILTTLLLIVSYLMVGLPYYLEMISYM